MPTMSAPGAFPPPSTLTPHRRGELKRRRRR